MSFHEAAVYRDRAAHLRSLARRLRTTPSMSLHLHAGVDTWYGPRADECTWTLALARRAVHDAADDLDVCATAFECCADDLSALARRARRDAASEAT